LYAPIGREPLRSPGSDSPGQPAVISNYTLPSSGDFTIVAASSSIPDRGAYTLTLQTENAAAGDRSQVEGMLNDGDTISGTVETRTGDEWHIRGCINDAVSLTVESNDFVPYVGIFAPIGRQKLVEDYGEGNTASINSYVLEESGLFVVTAAGAGIRMRGDYRLTFNVVDRPLNVPVTSATSESAGDDSVPLVTGAGEGDLALGGQPAATPVPTAVAGNYDNQQGNNSWITGHATNGNSTANQGMVDSNSGNQQLVCNNFNGPENWASTVKTDDTPDDFYYEWYGGWGFDALDGGIYDKSSVTSTRERTASLGNNNSSLLSRDGREEFSAKIASSQPYAGFYGSPTILVPSGFEGGKVLAKVRYFIWDDNRGVRRDGDEWVNLIVKPNSAGPGENAQTVAGYTRGTWAEINMVVPLGSARDVMFIIQAWSKEILNSNIYIDDISIGFTNGTTTRWLQDCVTAESVR
jgi:hypothetical protein